MNKINREKLENLKESLKAHKEMLGQAMEIHRGLKSDLLELMESMNTPNVTKQTAQDRLFEIYKKLK